MRLIFFLFIFIELFIGFSLMRALGLLNTLLIYFIPTILAMPMMTLQNRVIWAQFQRHLALGRTPDAELMSLVAKFFGAIFFVIPSIILRVLSLLLWFPLSRRFFIFIARGWLAKKMAQGSFRVFGSAPGFRYGAYSTYNTGGDFASSPHERDAKVIDIEALNLPPDSSDEGSQS